VADRQDSDREVLTSLPRSRPVRRSAKRAARPDAANGAEATAKRAAKAPRPAAEPRAKAAPKTTAARRPASARTPRPVAAAGERRPTAARTARAAASADERAAPRRKIPPAGYAAPTPHAHDDRVAASADLVGTAVQAAGELAQIGFAVGRQALQSMLDRLPKP
jgi:hypothetical protein